jgi:hypothetical protein
MAALTILLQNRENVFVERDFGRIRRGQNDYACQENTYYGCKCPHANGTSFRGAALLEL